MRMKLGDLPEAARRRVELEIGAGCGVDGGKPRNAPCGHFRGVCASSAKRIDRLNKTELRFWHYMGFGSSLSAEVVVQPPRLFELTGGGTYTPDFVEFSYGGVRVFEVKGGYFGAGWEQGVERYRRAAAQFARPWMRFCLAEWVRSEGRWVLTWWDE